MKTNKQINKYALKWRILWLYIKYQIISKLIVGILVLPLFHFITQVLINTSWRTNISSGDYIGFFTSLSWFPVILLGILVLVFVLGTDIIAFIILSALVKENKLKVKIIDIFLKVIASLKYFFSPVGALLVLFVSIVLPLLDLWISIWPLKDFAVPNFITSVIFGNTFYMILYSLALLGLTIISIIYIFTLHFVIIDNQKLKKALKSSKFLIKKYYKNFIIDYIWKIIKITSLLFVIGFIFMWILIILSLFLGLFINEEVLIISLIISFFQILWFFALLGVPISIWILTDLFYKYNNLEKKKIEFNMGKSSYIWEEDLYRKIKVKTKLELSILLFLIIFFNFLTAFSIKENFKEIFKTEINVKLITHRWGWDLWAENTANGIKKAIEKNAAFTEIDVQRTKDGVYIINHDKNFKRVAWVDKKPSEMTFDEIKKLKVKNEFEPEKPSEEVPTLEEILDISKWKIWVFIELKWETADEKMVDDVVVMIKKRNMIDEAVILSLDYDIIKYTEKKYPEIETGFLYFFSVWELKNLEWDYLIMEEREATPKNIAEIHASWKKAIVWTVNTDESIEKFIYSDVDGIITDHIMLIKEAIEDSKNKTRFEIIIDGILREI